MKQIPSDFSPIAVHDFEERTGIQLASVSAEYAPMEVIVAPRDIQEVSAVSLMPDAYRDQLLASIGIAYNRNRKVYKRLEVHLWMVDPNAVRVGQKFVYLPNIISLITDFRESFKGFGTIRGFTQGGAYLIMGTHEGKRALAHYLPPIVEIHGDQWILMDGVHRTYLARQAGVPLQCLVVHGVQLTFPCAPHSYNEVGILEEKPPHAKDRYWDLDPNLFRDLKYVGIDG